MSISSDNCKLCGKPVGDGPRGPDDSLYCPNTLSHFLIAHTAMVEMQEDLELAGVEPPEPKDDE